MKIIFFSPEFIMSKRKGLKLHQSNNETGFCSLLECVEMCFNSEIQINRDEIFVLINLRIFWYINIFFAGNELTIQFADHISCFQWCRNHTDPPINTVFIQRFEFSFSLWNFGFETNKARMWFIIVTPLGINLMILMCISHIVLTLTLLFLLYFLIFSPIVFFCCSTWKWFDLFFFLFF